MRRKACPLETAKSTPWVQQIRHAASATAGLHVFGAWAMATNPAHPASPGCANNSAHENCPTFVPCPPPRRHLTEGISSSTSCGDTTITESNSSSVTLGGTLAVRSTIVCTSSYAVSEGDINTLEVPSAASVTAKDVSGNTVNDVGTTLVSLDQVESSCLSLSTINGVLRYRVIE